MDDYEAPSHRPGHSAELGENIPAVLQHRIEMTELSFLHRREKGKKERKRKKEKEEKRQEHRIEVPSPHYTL